MSDSDAEEPKPPKKSAAAGQPLPRLWKTEPESSEDEFEVLPEQPGAPNKTEKTRTADEPPPSPPVNKSKSTPAKPKKPTAPVAGDDKKNKKVLKEDTPALDTIESRQRARLLMGGLIVSCVLLMGWITYRVFLYNPSPIDVTAGADATTAQGSPEIRLNLDQEARFMFNEARDRDKQGQTEQAVALLTRVVAVYKGTQTAADAKTALARTKQNLPLFLDRPVVVAEPTPAEPPPVAPPPPAVVAVAPTQPTGSQGQNALVLPANPSEMIVAPPSLRDKIATAGGTAVPPRALPSGFHAKLEANVHDSGWPMVIVGDRDGAPMVLVPGGSFSMGNDEGSPPEAPAHTVRLSTFYVDQHEVTNRQFRLFLGESHYRGQPPGKWLTDEKARAEPEALPVVMVNANDAKAFADWAGKQLPTEAQWEMAARSSESRLYPWGNEPTKTARPRVLHQITPVMSGSEDVSPYGAFDLAGNVVEWTKDWYDSKYYRGLAGRTTDNPTGPSTRGRSLQPQLVVKGGAKNWSVSYREGIPLEKRLPYLGFRCILPVETTIPGPAQPAVSPTQPGAVPAQPGSPQQPAPSTKPDVPF